MSLSKYRNALDYVVVSKNSHLAIANLIPARTVLILR